MDFYSASLAVLCVGAALLFRRHPFQGVKGNDAARRTTARELHWRFLVVYGLAVGIDWLQVSWPWQTPQASLLTGAIQGPYLYAWYRYEMQLPEEKVALLYATGFASGAVSAAMAGPLMNRFGPEMGCQAYFIFAVFSLSWLGSRSLPMLLLGRVFGGISTTLLFTAFESWMIAQYRLLRLDDSVLPLGTVFSNMSLVSSLVAIAMGIVSDALVRITGIQRLPFTIACSFCLLASNSMLFLWQGYEDARLAHNNRSTGLARGLWLVISDSRIRALGLASFCFEGAIYLFVFFWTPALKNARQQAGAEGELPLGFIFASFMCAMLIGSMVVSVPGTTFSRRGAAKDLLIVMLFASWNLSLITRSDGEWVLFLIFCVIEASIGAYFPVIGYLKSQYISDEDRNVVYSIFRLPMNLLVLCAHGLDREGERNGAQAECHEGTDAKLYRERPPERHVHDTGENVVCGYVRGLGRLLLGFQGSRRDAPRSVGLHGAAWLLLMRVDVSVQVHTASLEA